jgi:hypothetical protein
MSIQHLIDKDSQTKEDVFIKSVNLSNNNNTSTPSSGLTLYETNDTLYYKNSTGIVSTISVSSTTASNASTIDYVCPRGLNDIWSLPNTSYESSYLSQFNGFLYSLSVNDDTTKTRYTTATNVQSFSPLNYTGNHPLNVCSNGSTFIGIPITYTVPSPTALYYQTSLDGTFFTSSGVVAPFGLASYNIIFNSFSNLYVSAFFDSTFAWISTSPDGITWSIRLYDIVSGSNFSYFAQHENIIVLTSADFTSPLYSLDGGITWGQSTTPASTQAVCYSLEKKMFVSLGGLSGVYYSYDGITWILSPITGVAGCIGIIYVPAPVSQFYITTTQRNGNLNYAMSSFSDVLTPIVNANLDGSVPVLVSYNNIIYVPESDSFLLATDSGVAYSTKRDCIKSPTDTIVVRAKPVGVCNYINKEKKTTSNTLVETSILTPDNCLGNFVFNPPQTSGMTLDIKVFLRCSSSLGMNVLFEIKSQTNLIFNTFIAIPALSTNVPIYLNTILTVLETSVGTSCISYRDGGSWSITEQTASYNNLDLNTFDLTIKMDDTNSTVIMDKVLSTVAFIQTDS